MTIPKGYSNKKNNKVCKLVRSLYRLKQASRQWNKEFSQFLIRMGFLQSKHDYSLCTKACGEGMLAVIVYVDDILIYGDS